MSYVDPWTEGVRLIPEAATTFVAPGDLEAVNTLPTSRASFVAPGSLTAGRYGLFRYDMLPGSGGGGTHIHTTFSESFYVLSGVVSLYDGHHWLRGQTGSFLYVPERSVHGFKNDSMRRRAFWSSLPRRLRASASSARSPRRAPAAAGSPTRSGATSTGATISTWCRSAASLVALEEPLGGARGASSRGSATMRPVRGMGAGRSVASAPWGGRLGHETTRLHVRNVRPSGSEIRVQYDAVMGLA